MTKPVELHQLILPTGIRAQLLQLELAIKAGESIQAINMCEQRAQGFVMGLEAAAALKTDLIETLYIGFESTAQQCRTRLRDM